MAGQQAVLKFLKNAAKNIDWGKILGIVAPYVKDKIEDLIGRIGRNKSSSKENLSLSDLNRRISDIEQLNIAIGLNKIPEIENKQALIAEALQTLSARVTILIIVSGLALIISVAATVLLFLR